MNLFETYLMQLYGANSETDVFYEYAPDTEILSYKHAHFITYTQDEVNAYIFAALDEQLQGDMAKTMMWRDALSPLMQQARYDFAEVWVTHYVESGDYQHIFGLVSRAERVLGVAVIFTMASVLRNVMDIAFLDAPKNYSDLLEKRLKEEEDILEGKPLNHGILRDFLENFFSDNPPEDWAHRANCADTVSRCAKATAHYALRWFRRAYPDMLRADMGEQTLAEGLQTIIEGSLIAHQLIYDTFFVDGDIILGNIDEEEADRIMMEIFRRVMRASRVQKLYWSIGVPGISNFIDDDDDDLELG